MTILDFGTSVYDFSFGHLAYNVENDTNAANIAPYVSTGIKINSGVATENIKLAFAAQTDVWFSGYARWSFTSGTLTLFQIDDTAGAGLWRLARGSNLTLQIWNGASWDIVATGSTSFGSSSGLKRFDVHLSLDNVTGVFEIYLDGVLEATFTGDTIRTASTTFDAASYRNIAVSSTSNTTVWSAMFASTTDSKVIDYQQLLPNANGTATSWTGDFNNINSGVVGQLDDIGGIRTTASAQAEQFGVTNTNVALAGRTVVAVGVSGRGFKGQTGPTNLEVGVRSGTTDSWATPFALDTVGKPTHAIFATNPDTASDWTLGEVDTMEIGVRSQT